MMNLKLDLNESILILQKPHLSISETSWNLFDIRILNIKVQNPSSTMTAAAMLPRLLTLWQQLRSEAFAWALALAMAEIWALEALWSIGKIEPT